MNCKTDLRFDPVCPSYDFLLRGKQLFMQILLEIILLYETVLFLEITQLIHLVTLHNINCKLLFY